MTSELFLTAAKLTLLILLLVQAVRVWGATARHCDKLRRARAIAKIRRARENRHRQMFWSICSMIADGSVPTRAVAGGGWELVPPPTRRLPAETMARLQRPLPTRRITTAEWHGASADIRRELKRKQWN